MFRRPGKSPFEKDYEEESSPYASPKFGTKTAEASHLGEIAPRVFDPPTSQKEEWSSSYEKTAPLPHPFQGVGKEEAPETTLGEGVTFRGELAFERLLRIDGTFEGELLSQGKVVVGPKGKVKANLNLREAIIEGEVDGNITVQERLELRGEASINGDIQAKTLTVDEGVAINGHVLVTPASSDTP